MNLVKNESATHGAPFRRGAFCRAVTTWIQPPARRGAAKTGAGKGTVRSWPPGSLVPPYDKSQVTFINDVAEMSLIWINGDRFHGSHKYARSSASRTRCPARGARFVDPCARLIDLQFKEEIGIRTEPRRQHRRRWRAIEPITAGLFAWTSLAAVKRRDVAQAQVRNDAAARLDTEALHHSNHVVRMQFL